LISHLGVTCYFGSSRQIYQFNLMSRSYLYKSAKQQMWGGL